VLGVVGPAWAVSTLGLKSDVVETWLVANLVLQKRLNTHRPFWGGDVWRYDRWLAPPAKIVVPSLPEQNTVLKDQLLEDPYMQ